MSDRRRPWQPLTDPTGLGRFEHSTSDQFGGLDALALRFGLSGHQVGRLRAFAQILASDARAPTTVREPAAIVADHLADALVALELPELASAFSVADLGSGAGVPGIPLAVAMPATRVALVDGNGRKCAFMLGVVRDLALENVEVVNARAESFGKGRAPLDAVTARALGPLDVVAEYAAPLLRLGGALVVWRGQRDPAAERDAGRAAEVLGLEPRQPVRVLPYAGALHRHLHVFVKCAPTPARFPRRPGLARKRPLGQSLR
jgi:16S rRNA (guanine527-N7)-methyltransferase